MFQLAPISGFEGIHDQFVDHADRIGFDRKRERDGLAVARECDSGDLDWLAVRFG